MESNNNTVSVVVDRTVLPGKIAEFEDCLKNIIEASSKFAGYLGTDVINPDGNNRYLLIFRFSSQYQLDDWSASEPRNFWVNKINRLIEKPTQLNTLTGFETWFYLSQSNNFVPPPKYKMAIVTYLAIAPTIMVFDLLLGRYFSWVPGRLSIFATAPFIVILMTYLVMPIMTKLFKRFLYPKVNIDSQ